MGRLIRPRSPFTKAQFRLRELPSDRVYKVVDLETDTTRESSGRELTEQGVAVELRRNPDSALLRYRVCEGGAGTHWPVRGRPFVTDSAARAARHGS